MYAVRQALLIFRLHDQFVYDNFDVVHTIAVEFHSAYCLAQFAVDADGQKAFSTYRFKEFFVVSFALSHKRREQKHLFAFILL